MTQKEIYKENNNCKIKKIELYEYIDLSNYTSYLNKIEKKAEKNDQFSFKVLLDDFDKNIIYNDDMLKFKKDINKKLDQMEKYFEKGYLLRLEQLNEEITYIDIKTNINVIYPRILYLSGIQIIMINNKNEIVNGFSKTDAVLISYINLYCFKIKKFVFSIKVFISYNKFLLNSIGKNGNKSTLFIVFVKKGIG